MSDPLRIPLEKLAFMLLFSGTAYTIRHRLGDDAASTVFIWSALGLLLFRDRLRESGFFS